MTIDIIVLLILAACVFIGWKKGLIITIFNFFSMIISVVVARLIYPDVAKIFRSSGFIYDGLKDKIGEQLSTGIESSLAESGNKIDQNFFSSLKLPSFMTDALSKNYDNEVNSFFSTTKDNVQDYISGFIANAVISIVAVIVTIIVIFTAMRLIGMVLKIVSRLPVIKTLNKMGGALVGAVLGVIVAWIVLAVLVIFFSQGGTDWADTVDKSTLAKFLQENNIIFKIVVGIIR